MKQKEAKLYKLLEKYVKRWFKDEGNTNVNIVMGMHRTLERLERSRKKTRGSK